MYVPKLNRVDDAAAIAMVRAAKFGHLVSATAEGLVSTGLPFTVDTTDDRLTLRGHVARANPHWKGLDGIDALVIFPLTDAYVSPAWYETKAVDPKVVPTWNYEVAHVHGTVRVRDDADWKLQMVSDLTNRHERDRPDDAPAWAVSDAPADFIASQLCAIVGLEVEVERVEAKRKMSQNKSDGDHEGVIDGLSDHDDARSTAVAASMERDRPKSAPLQTALDEIDAMFAKRRS